VLSGLFPIDLQLVARKIVLILSNLYASRGISNGIRMNLLTISKCLLRCKLIEGKYVRDELLISIIPLHGDDPRLPSRCQFLVIGTFEMIINNKPQGNQIGVTHCVHT
jgi:hypothetical protein